MAHTVKKSAPQRRSHLGVLDHAKVDRIAAAATIKKKVNWGHKLGVCSSHAPHGHPGARKRYRLASPKAGVQVGLDRPPHSLEHHQISPRRRFCQLGADLHGRNIANGVMSTSSVIREVSGHSTNDPVLHRSLTFDRSMTGSPEPLATTCSCLVETPLHSSESAAQICKHTQARGEERACIWSGHRWDMLQSVWHAPQACHLREERF